MATSRRAGTNEVVWTMGASGRDYTNPMTWSTDFAVDITTGIEQVSISSVSGTRFNPKEALTFTGSGATGVCYGTNLARTLLYYIVSTGTPLATDVISGDVSGATATLDSVDNTNTGTTQWLEVYNDAEHDVAIDIGGATTSAVFFRGVRPAIGEKHTGSPNTGARFNSTVLGVGSVVRLREPYSVSYDMELACAINSASNIAVIDVLKTAMAGATASIIGNIIDTPTNAGSGQAYGLNSTGSNVAATLIIVNNIVISPKFIGLQCVGAAATNYLYNNTVYGCGERGIRAHSGTVVAINNISDSNVGNDYDGTFDASSDRNVASDTTAPGTNETDSANPVYVNEGAGDLHIITANAFLGADLSADVNFAFNDDIDGDMIAANKWSAGADSTPIVTAKTLKLTGTQAQINASLATLKYTPDAGFRSRDTLTMVSEDALGNTDTDTLKLKVQ